MAFQQLFCLREVLSGSVHPRAKRPVKFLWRCWFCMIALVSCLPVHADCTLILPGTPAEKEFLIEDHSALREIGYDPLRPFTRVADGQTMYYTYRFQPGREHAAYLLVTVGSQFLISVSDDEGAHYQPVADMNQCERMGSRIFVDLTPFLHRSDSVRVRFEDRYKEDGWGALTSEILYYHGQETGPARLALDQGWQADGRVYTPGARLSGTHNTLFRTSFNAPDGWAGADLAIYLSGVTGSPRFLRVNGTPLGLRRTWDRGWWATLPGSLVKSKTVNWLEVGVVPHEGKLGLWTPVRVGLRLPACAVAIEKRCGPESWRPVRQFEPYTPEKMNFLAGNFLQSLYDSRYDLLAFAPDERMSLHFVHDTLRSLAALAEEERYTGVARLELARRLYQGCRRAVLPGGEFLFAYKHDRRPVEIRPLPETSCLTLVHKLDEARTVAAIGVTLPGSSAGVASSYVDTPPTAMEGGTEFTRTWRFGSVRLWHTPSLRPVMRTQRRISTSIWMARVLYTLRSDGLRRRECGSSPVRGDRKP